MPSLARRRRIVALSALAALAAVVLSGCLVIKGAVTVVQQDVIGKVRVSFTVCASGADDGPEPGGPGEDHPGCTDAGNSGQTASTGTVQALFALRVPAGTGAPQSFPATAPGGPLTFTRSPSYERELTELVPPPAGQVWIGYLSSSYTFDDGADDAPAQEMPVAIDLDLPRSSDGTPFAGPFRVRPVVGARGVSTNFPASRPVECGETAFGASFNPGIPSVVCIDSPSSATTATNIELATRDLGIAGGGVAADPGRQVTVPFTARYAGTATAAASFSFSASSSLAGAKPAPTSATLTPAANSSNAVGVRVTVPKSAAAGDYSVSLRARLANGQERTGTARLTVNDKTLPVATRLRVAPKSFVRYSEDDSIVAAGGARISYRLSEAGTVRFTVQRSAKGRRVGRRCVAQRRSNRRRKSCSRFVAVRGSFTHAARAGSNSFRFTGVVRRRALKRGSYRLNGAPTDLARNRGRTVRAAFRIRR